MVHLRSLRVVATAFAFALYLVYHTSVYGCGLADSRPETADDYIVAEQAVIIWDSERKIEHFIRQADIHTSGPDVGFLVPTPQTPEVTEVSPQIFSLAADVAQPKPLREITYRTPLVIFSPLMRGPLVLASPFYATMSGMSDQTDDEPRIVAQEDVAGYHAVTLDANSPTALANWLNSNKYVTTPELVDWLKPYIDQKWKITAFKLVKGVTGQSVAANNPVATRAIRMSFPTTRPFFPYSEPGDKKHANQASPYGRTLKIAFIGPERMQGNLEDGSRWPADLLYAGPPEPAPRSRWQKDEWLFFAKLDGQLTLPTTLTYWRDRSDPRPGTADLEFASAQDQSSYRKAEIDYSLTALHLIDLTHTIDDLQAFLIIVVLPGAPLYCALRILRSKRPTSSVVPPSRYRLFADKFLGFASAAMGGFYAVSCCVIAYLLVNVEDYLPGYPLPFLSRPSVAIFVSLLFFTLIYSGIRTFNLTAVELHAKVTGRWHRAADYVAVAISLSIGSTFAIFAGLLLLNGFLD